MFRLILTITQIDYNGLIDLVDVFMKQNKDNPAMKDMKIPGFGFGFLKKMPDDKKAQMLTGVLNQDKARSIQTLESALTGKIGSIRITDMMVTDTGCDLKATIDVGAYDFDKGIDLLYPATVTPADFSEILGENLPEGQMEDVNAFMDTIKALPLGEKEIAFLRTLRMKKDSILFRAEEALRAKNIQLHFAELKVLVKA